MLIPSIDLRGGQVVQLVQGRDVALASDDVLGWVQRFEGYRAVQLIDLDAALGTGSNEALVQLICRRLPCRVGGGIRSVERARTILDQGATAVVVGSALFRDGVPDLDAAGRFRDGLGEDRLIAAVDSFRGRVVVRGWREATSVTTTEAMAALSPFCGEFLYTHVDTEGLMQGIDLDAVGRARRATSRRLTVAGGITSPQEIAALDAMGVDAVVGMAIYTGRLAIDGLEP